MHLDGATRRIEPSAGARGGWDVSGTAIDDWLAAHGAPPLAERVPVLAFGSNRCPSKISWLRSELGLTGPVVALRVTVSGVAAVWAAGWRARDGARPATLAVVPPSPGARNVPFLSSGERTAPHTHEPAAPGADTVPFLSSGERTVPLTREHEADPDAEIHHVWLATTDQVGVLDRCEGRGERYALAWVQAARVADERGAPLDPVLAYWPADPVRAPLLVDGAPVRCRDVSQDDARALDGVAGEVRPDAATVVPAGVPDAPGWPARVFVYGTLQPGASAWWRLAPAAVSTWPAVTAGRVHDTGRGYPALVRDTDALAPGHVVELDDPVAVLPALDAYEGPGYRRERVAVYRLANAAERSVADPPELCWAWIWDGPAGDWPVVSGSWRD